MTCLLRAKRASEEKVQSELRRGQDTANSVFGNEASVLVGDFLYSRSFQLMVQVGHMRIMDVLADATNTIAEGAPARKSSARLFRAKATADCRGVGMA